MKLIKTIKTDEMPVLVDCDMCHKDFYQDSDKFDCWNFCSEYCFKRYQKIWFEDLKKPRFFPVEMKVLKPTKSGGENGLAHWLKPKITGSRTCSQSGSNSGSSLSLRRE